MTRLFLNNALFPFKSSEKPKGYLYEKKNIVYTVKMRGSNVPP